MKLVLRLLLTSSLSLYCVAQEDDSHVGTVAMAAQEENTAAPEGKEATAVCDGGKISCSGAKEWCAQQTKECGGSCSPSCTYQCDSPKCDEACAPVCKEPVCSTRCKGLNTDSCQMKCEKPVCTVVCPKHFCPNQNCAACQTKCGEPKCNMVCGDDEQECHNVCAEPVCNFECKPGECPKPKCKLVCDKVSNCDAQGLTMVASLPDLKPGESEVSTSFGAVPADLKVAALPQVSAATVRVNVTTMGADRSIVKRALTLPLMGGAALEAVQVGATWTKKYREHTLPNGKVTQSEASCKGGLFQCKGDESWCSEQKKSLCGGGKGAILQQRSLRQGHLRA